MPPKSKMASDSDMTSTLVTLNKWLKAQDVSTVLDIPGQDVPDGLRYAILFLDCLRSSRHFPGKLTYGESNLLQVIEELSCKIDRSANEASAASSKAPAAPKRKKEDDKENVPKGKAKMVKKAEKEGDNRKAEKPGPKSKKLAPLSAAQNQQSKGCGCKGDCKTKVCGCVKRNAQCSSPCKCLASCVNKKKESRKPQSEEEEEEEEEVVEEETAKTTKTAKSAKSGSEESQSDDEEMSGDDESGDGLGTETVDWDKHITSLVECQKCKRKFFPSRIVRHQEVCKNT